MLRVNLNRYKIIVQSLANLYQMIDYIMWKVTEIIIFSSNNQNKQMTELTNN